MSQFPPQSSADSQYASVTQRLPLGYALHEIVVDDEGTPVDYRFLDVNPAFEAMTSLDAKAIRGRRVTEVLPGIERDPADWIGLYGDIALNGGDRELEMFSESLNRWYAVTAFQTEPGRFATLVRDVTEARERHLRLQKVERRLSALFNEVEAVPIQGIDEQRRVIFWNAASERLYGYTREEAMGQPVETLLFPDSMRDEIIRPIRDWIERGISIPAGELELQRKNGDRVQVFSSYVMTETPEGHKEIFSIDVDLTHRNLVERERMRMERLESLGLVAGGIAHDFNNLLTGVFGCLELAEMILPPGHQAREVLARGSGALESARRLTAKLLTFSKGGNPTREPFHPDEVLRESVRFHLSGSSVREEFDLPPDLWPLYADKAQFDQIVANLTVNAVQAMPEGGRFRVRAANRPEALDPRTGERGPAVEFSFEDTGIGIPEAERERIFDPYHTTKPNGTGLGLAVVHSIVTKHRGTIRVESSVGSGTRFRLWLPALPPEKNGEQDSHEKDAYGGARTGRVLLMDDEQILLDVGKYMLEQLGYEVDTAREGGELLQRYRNVREGGSGYDLVIMDLTIPGGMGGRDTVRELRKLNPKVPVIVASGYSSDDVLANPSEYGFDGSLAKPYRIGDLSAEIDRVLGTRSAGE